MFSTQDDVKKHHSVDLKQNVDNNQCAIIFIAHVTFYFDCNKPGIVIIRLYMVSVLLFLKRSKQYTSVDKNCSSYNTHTKAHELETSTIFYLIVVPILDTKVTKYLCSGWAFFLQTKFDFLTRNF